MIKKIGIFTDTHGNLSAALAITQAFAKYGCDEIFHLGDMITMGAYSKECLNFFFSQKRALNLTLLAGNHDLDYAKGHTQKRPGSNIDPAHKEFIFNSIGESYKKRILRLGKQTRRTIGGTKFAFLHYALAKRRSPFVFLPICHDVTPQNLDDLFIHTNAEVIIFGHKHDPMELAGKKVFNFGNGRRGVKKYFDIGSVGCHAKTFARGVILHADDKSGEWQIEQVQAEYDRRGHFDEMLKRGVPDAKFIQDLYFKEAENRGEKIDFVRAK